MGRNASEYLGMFECATHRPIDAPDKNQQVRNAIVFDLIPVSTAALCQDEGALQGTGASAPSIDALRKAAYDAANPAQNSAAGIVQRTWYERSEAVKRYVLARAARSCEACGNPAPFTRKDGTPYLEPHHTKRLADDGLDHPAWVGAICLNCHRRIHSGEDGEEWNQKLLERLGELEKLG
jgi:5-methylcytosine-specific restriction protein A